VLESPATESFPAALGSTSELPPNPFPPPLEVELAPAVAPEPIAPALELVVPDVVAAPLLPEPPPADVCSGGAWSVQPTANTQASPSANAKALDPAPLAFPFRVTTTPGNTAVSSRQRVSAPPTGYGRHAWSARASRRAPNAADDSARRASRQGPTTCSMPSSATPRASVQVTRPCACQTSTSTP